MRYSFIHIPLALLVFVSASGLLVNDHFCQGIWKGASLFVAGEACHFNAAKAMTEGHHTDLPKATPPSHCHSSDKAKHHSGKPMPEKDCCDDETQLIKVDHEKSFEFASLKDFPQAPVFPLKLHLRVRENQDVRTRHFLNHKPPLLRADPQTELQTFRC